MRLKKLLKIIEELLPPESAMKGDRLGLQIQSGREEVKSLLITLELSDGVVEEAAELQIDCIICFHPLIYAPLVSIIDNDRVGRISSKLIKNEISLISVHTSFDAYSNGTSRIFAEKLGLEVIDFLVPDDSIENTGMGVIAKSNIDLDPQSLLKKVSEISSSPVRYCMGNTEKKIKHIGILGGSGSSFLNDENTEGLDAFITADITYHTFHAYADKLMLIDPGHYEMEQFVPRGLYELLITKLDKNEYDKLFTSKTLTNPVVYYPNGPDFIFKQKNHLLKNI